MATLGDMGAPMNICPKTRMVHLPNYMEKLLHFQKPRGRRARCVDLARTTASGGLRTLHGLFNPKRNPKAKAANQKSIRHEMLPTLSTLASAEELWLGATSLSRPVQEAIH